MDSMDKEILDVLSEQATSAAAMLLACKNIRESIESALLAAGIGNSELTYNDRVAAIMHFVKADAPGITTEGLTGIDLVKCVQYCLCSAYRFSSGLEETIQRKYNPAHPKSVEDPLEV